MAEEPILPDEFLEESSLTLEEYLALDPNLTEEQFRKAQEPLQEEVTLLEYISKNFTGPEGQPGEQGQRGYRGPKGVPGERGVDGRQGKTGQTGPMGLTGPEGAAGPAGANGTQGPQGVEGPQGPIGPRGNDGDKGDTGSPGQAGPHGTRGVDGREGPEGPRGLQGPEGSQGPEGPRGKDGRDGKDGGTPTIPADGPPEKSTMRRLGFKERDAAPGNHWHHMPESQHARRHGLRLGIDPIFPRDGTANGRVLAFNDGSPDYLEWVVQTGGGGTAAGPTGATGPQGPPGPPGLDGDDGMMGPVGAIGPPGDTGPAGSTGATGATGAQGIPGNDGATGATGPAGTDGIIGSNGAPGLDGQDGQDGPPGPKGDKGDTGDTGATGAAGAAGATGATGSTGPAGNDGAAGAAGATGATGATGSTGSQGAPGLDGLDGQDGIPGIDGSAPQFHNEMTTALAIRPDIHIMGKGLAVQDNSGRTEIVAGAYYDAIIDSNDTNAIGKGNVYDKIVDAITAGHKTIFVKSAIDTVDISISSGASILRLVGDASLGTAIPVNITCAKVGVAFEFLNFTSKRLKWQAARCIAIGCFFSGTITPGSGLINSAPLGTRNIVSSTNASPIVVTLTAHGYSSGDYVTIAGHATNTNANGSWRVTNLTANTFSLAGSNGNGVGGATGTANKEGINNAVLSIPWDNGANGGLPSGGYAMLENEPIGYRSGGGASSGTLVVGTTARRGMWESAGLAHPDNATITDMTDGHLIIEADDCTVLTCQFVSCIGPYTHCIIQRTGVARMRVVSSTFLSNTTWSCIAMVPANDSSTDYGRNSISACVFDTNTCSEALIDTFQPNTANNTNRASCTGVSINGCLFKDFPGIAIRQYGIVWNISGNVFEQTTISTQQVLINNAAGIDATQNFIPVDNLTGNGTSPYRTLARIDSEIVSFIISATPYVAVGRGLAGTTAATHADNAAVVYLPQIAVFVVPGPTSIAGVVLVAGCIFQTTKNPVFNYELDWTGNIGTAPGYTIETCALNQGTVTLGANWSMFSNGGTVAADCRSKTGIVFVTFRGTLTPSNMGTDTFLMLAKGAAGGQASGNMFASGTIFSFGRLSGDLGQIGNPMVNRTAATSVVSNVVIYDVTNDNSFVNAGVIVRSTIVAGVVLNAVADLADTIVADQGVVTVNCDTGAVVVGDRLGTSLITAGLASSIAAPTIGQTFAIAQTAKAAGSNGTVKARMRFL